MKFCCYEKRPTQSGEAFCALFEMTSSSGSSVGGEEHVHMWFTKYGVKQHIATMKDGDEHLLMIAILHQWPDDNV